MALPASPAPAEKQVLSYWTHDHHLGDLGSLFTFQPEKGATSLLINLSADPWIAAFIEDPKKGPNQLFGLTCRKNSLGIYAVEQHAHVGKYSTRSEESH